MEKPTQDARRHRHRFAVRDDRFDMKEFSAREARYGLRGVRSGEASHPISLAEIFLPDSDSDSDDEPLVIGPCRPGLRTSSPDESRSVVPGLAVASQGKGKGFCGSPDGSGWPRTPGQMI